MAGFIHISDGKGYSFGSHFFRFITDRARDFFDEDESDVVGDLYDYTDATGESMIVLYKKDVRTYNAFARAVEKAYAHQIEIGDLTYQSIWEELIFELQSDPRYAKV